MSSKSTARRPGRPRAEDAPLSVDDMLKAALGVFATHGYDGVSVSALSRDLGVSHNLLHQRFGSKEGLWYAAVDWGFGGLADELARAADPTLTDPFDQLAVILRRASELKRLNQELNEAVLARDDFFSVASHELRTPLSTLTLQLHMLLGPAAAEGLPAPQLRSRLEVADRQVKRLNQLIDLLLDVTRIRAGKLDLRLEDGIDLGAVIREVAGGMELERQRFRCPLELQLAERVKGRWDAQRLDQVVTNLLSNAFKYGDQQKVTVTLTSEPASRSGQGVARLAVRDEGIGMTPEEVSRIFQRFERAGVVREYTTGLGLGLWITQQIVLRLGGAIETQSTPKRGSTFIVTLPLVGPVE